MKDKELPQSVTWAKIKNKVCIPKWLMSNGAIQFKIKKIAMEKNNNLIHQVSFFMYSFISFIFSPPPFCFRVLFATVLWTWSNQRRSFLLLRTLILSWWRLWISSSIQFKVSSLGKLQFCGSYQLSQCNNRKNKLLQALKSQTVLTIKNDFWGDSNACKESPARFFLQK